MNQSPGQDCKCTTSLARGLSEIRLASLSAVSENDYQNDLNQFFGEPMKSLIQHAAVLFALAVSSHAVRAQDQAETKLVPLNRAATVLLDKEHKKLLLKSNVCLREGVLEMFMCTKQSKEHESILTIDASAAVIHAGLLAIGAEPGEPVKFIPEFRPPQGQQIDIFVNWVDAEGKKHRKPAQEWVRGTTYRYFEEPLKSVPDGVVLDFDKDSLRYDDMNRLLLWFGTMSAEKREELLKMSSDKAYQAVINKMYRDSQPVQMDARFIFAGSKFSKLEDGTLYYQAEGGSLICVANFSDAMIDVDIQSSASDAAGRSFEPYTERLPPLDTPVTVELIPVQKQSNPRPANPDDEQK